MTLDSADDSARIGIALQRLPLPLAAQWLSISAPDRFLRVVAGLVENKLAELPGDWGQLLLVTAPYEEGPRALLHSPSTHHFYPATQRTGPPRLVVWLNGPDMTGLVGVHYATATAELLRATWTGHQQMGTVLSGEDMAAWLGLVPGDSPALGALLTVPTTPDGPPVQTAVLETFDFGPATEILCPAGESVCS